MNRVRNTAYSERTVATDFSGCQSARSKLLKVLPWGMRAGGSAVWRIIDSMFPKIADSSQSLCISEDSLWHLCECQVMCPHGNSGSPPQCHVCQEKIRVFIIHLQLWTAKMGGRTAGPGTTPNPYFPGLCNKRNIHLHRWKRDGREKERRQLLLQVEYRKVDSPSSTVYEDKPMSTFHVSWATTLRSSSQNFPGHSENHPVSPQNSI